jgi:hypothetical protein
MSLPSVGVRPSVQAAETAELVSTSGDTEQWTGFTLRWPGCQIGHFVVLAKPPPGSEWTPRTLRWVLRRDGKPVDDDWTDVYASEAGDLCVLDLGNVAPPIRSAVVTTTHGDWLPALLQTLEIVPLAELIGTDTLPLPPPGRG